MCLSEIVAKHLSLAEVRAEHSTRVAERTTLAQVRPEHRAPSCRVAKSGRSQLVRRVPRPVRPASQVAAEHGTAAPLFQVRLERVVTTIVEVVSEATAVQ